jgi:adenosylcobinamide-GDP ribazoletransferase
MTPRLREEVRVLALACAFLTRLPLPLAIHATPRRMAASLRYLPVIGALVGVVGAAVLLLAAQALPMAPAVLLSIAATCALTGALHEDGLADTLDSLGAASPERALEIMRDSRIGTFGALGLGLTIALKASALAAMPLAAAAAALIAAHAASRLSSLAVIATSRYARPTGTGGFTAAGVGRKAMTFATAAVAALLLAITPAAGIGAVLGGLVGLVAGHVLSRALFERRLGGYTGDCLGATQQLSEVGFYLGVLAWL